MFKFWNWLVRSSADPNKLSTTVKGFLLGVLPLLVLAFGMAHVNLDSERLTVIINDLALVIQYALGTVSAAVSVYGLIRKLVKTLNGTNAVLNEFSD